LDIDLEQDLTGKPANACFPVRSGHRS
jgi:hypothetical protein